MERLSNYPPSAKINSPRYTAGIQVQDLVFDSGQGPLNPTTGKFEARAIIYVHECETSLVLCMRRDHFELENARDVERSLEDAWLNGAKRVAPCRRFASMTAIGSPYAPSAATAENETSMLTAVVDDVVAFVEDVARWQMPSTFWPAEESR